ncbi:hypothetical protein B0H11DRAFT_2259129 [Mycena galericulata]|nr:hypothetical protein B0H11DRAFT_2259129 [Mycena galericulata]
MARKKKGGAPGRAGAFSGEKLTWLESFESEFRTQERGAFYDDVSKRFLKRYGYDLPVEDNVEGDVEAWTPVDRKAGLTGEALAEENAFQADALKKLRGKLGNWYRHRFTGKKLHKGALREILHRMQAMSGAAARPRRKSNVAFYSDKYYATRLKEGFDALWAGAKLVLPDKRRVSMCQEYVQKRWDEEDADFRTALINEANEEHAANMKKFRESHVVVEGTPESYHKALENFDEVGIPLADALAERLGMHVVIMAVGPVGKQRGEVRLRTVFSETSGGATSKIWGEFDRAGFTEAEKSLTRYGRAFFTKEECRARVWSPPEGGEGAAPEVGEGAAPEVGESAAPEGSGGAAPEGSGGAAPSWDDLLQIDAAPPTLPVTATSGTPAPPPPATLPPSPPEAEVDRWGWSEALKNAYDYLASKTDWGPRWKELIEAVVEFEKSLLHMEGRLPPEERPDEIAQWMKEHRPDGDYPVDDDFGKRLLGWWRGIGPVYRRKPRPADLPADDPWLPKAKWDWVLWCRTRKGGGNGMMLVARAVAWWGQTIYNAGEGAGLGGGKAALDQSKDWQCFVEDLVWSLGEMTDELEPELVRELEEERREMEAAAKEAERGAKAGKGKGGKKAKAPPKDGPAPAKATKKASAKRKRADDEEEPKDAPPAKAASRPLPRPLPRPLTRAQRAAAALNSEAPANESSASTATASAEVGSGAGEGAVGSPAPNTIQDIEMPPTTAGVSGEQPVVDNDEDPFFEPFNEDPTAGMTAEERKDYEEEMRLDPDADEEDEEDDDEE